MQPKYKLQMTYSKQVVVVESSEVVVDTVVEVVEVTRNNLPSLNITYIILP